MPNKRLSIVILLVVSALLACNVLTSSTTQVPASEESGLNVETSVARTRAFNFTVQTAAAGQVQPAPQVESTTNQAPASTVESTPDVPTISASVDTNCRTGPATVYDAISYLLVGKTSEVVNKYQNGLWWVIKDPNNPNLRCWVWGTTTNVTGDWQHLPEATVPPTPTVFLSVEVSLTSLTPSSYSGPCPILLNGEGTITVTMPTTVSYVWERSAGPALESGTLTFDTAGSQSISFSINYLASSSDSVRIHITAPIDVYSNALTYDIVCTPY
ncbi:MAG: hypothetical protein JW704_05490 [Anaerolineaceae bacterium]|nr:hypothetical protein [Anaerolineaceae bacterium]